MQFIEGSFYCDLVHRCDGFLSRLDVIDAANLIARCGTLETRVGDLETGKANVNHAHAWNDITDKPTILSEQLPSDWNATSGATRILNKPRKVFSFKATVSGGNAVFYLTNDGTASGSAFFASGPDLNSMQLTPEEVDSPHTFGVPALSNSNKTLTVSVKKSVGVNVALLGLTLLGVPAAANGSVIRLLIAGAS